MARNFIKTLVITTVFATGISVSSAKAANNELGEFLAATIFMFALAGALGGDDIVVDEPRHKAPVVTRPSQGHGNRKALPKSCLTTYRTQQGNVKTFGKSCLEKNFRFTHRLPTSCEQTLWTSKGIREGFEPSCLRRYGYRAR
jgi:hypothetical protein